MNFKKFYSKYYNLVYKNKDYKSEVNYISQILKSEKNILKIYLNWDLEQGHMQCIC